MRVSMIQKRRLGSALSAVALLAVGSLGADTIVTLGQQDFMDGDLSIGTVQFDNASAGDPAPFDKFHGGDVDGPNFSESWTFAYTPTAAFAAATITLGVYDHDSVASGNQVAFFGVDGFDLTTSLNAAFESHGGSNGEYNVYTLNLPAMTFGLLQDGSATFTLTLMGPGYGALGDTASNGAGVDFSTLSLLAVPEPATCALLALGLGGAWLVAAWRRKA